MQLEKGEHSILSYYPSIQKARKAAQDLKDAGLVPEEGALQVDQINRLSPAYEGYNDPINNTVALNALIYSAGLGEEDANPLQVAMDFAGGARNPGAVVPGEHSFIVTLVTARENVSEALRIIRQNDGKA